MLKLHNTKRYLDGISQRVVR